MLQATTGPNWAEQVTAVGTAIIALSIFGTAVGAFLARRQLVEAKKLRHISLAIDLARRWDDDALISVRRSLKDASAERFKEIRRAIQGDLPGLVQAEHRLPLPTPQAGQLLRGLCLARGDRLPGPFVHRRHSRQLGRPLLADVETRRLRRPRPVGRLVRQVGEHGRQDHGSTHEVRAEHRSDGAEEESVIALRR